MLVSSVKKESNKGINKIIKKINKVVKYRKAAGRIYLITIEL